MSAKTSIEWTDVTWNPVRGCSLVSAGCQNCYAMRQAHRFGFKEADVGSDRPGTVEGPYYGLTRMTHAGPVWTGAIKLVPEALKQPLHWKKPRRIFVNSMSDLFHPGVSDEFIDRCFAVMSCAPQHTFQLLTKRPDRMRHYLSAPDLFARLIAASNERADGSGLAGDAFHQNFVTVARTVRGYPKNRLKLPLRNVWLGVSVENQETADERIPLLLETPAAVRFVSAEPLLGPVDFSVPWPPGWREQGDPQSDRFDALRFDDRNSLTRLRRLDWVIVGGESGPGARPCDIARIRSIKDQCLAGDVPVFIKQLGSKPIAAPGTTWDLVCRSIKARKGGEMDEWPKDLRVREFPAVKP